MQNRHGNSEKSLGTEALCIVVFAIAVFCVFALSTYAPTDPSWFSNTHSQALNACGKVGAYISSLALECFGVGAFLVPAALFFMSASIHKREGRVRLLGTLGGMTVAVTAATVFLTLQWKYWAYSGSIMLTGGAFGAWLTELLVKQFNSLGSSIVSILVFSLAIVFSTPLSVAKAGGWVFYKLGRVIWHASRLVGTYFAYLFGLLAMRSAHAAGDVLQRLIEGGIQRAKEKKVSLSQDRQATITDKNSEKFAEGRDGKRAAKEVKAMVSAVNPIIGNGDEADFDFDSGSEDDDCGSGAVIAAKSSKSAGSKNKADSTGPIIARTPIQLDLSEGEAPNVLPELGSKTAAKTSSVPTQAPEIMARESHDGSNESDTLDIHSLGLATAGAAKVAEAAAKAAAKLAKAARSNKRGQWKLPSLEFLKKVPKVDTSIDREKLIQNSQILTQKFADFGIDGEVTAVRPGPVITLYEFKPGPGVKVSRIAALADDLSMALSAQSVRILAPLPGKAVVGIEIPSDTRETVFMRELLQHPDFYGPKHMLPVAMGKDISGQTYLSDLARMPHLLCAGQTGSGKSVFMNGLICSLLYRFTPDELRMILVDPKFIEFRAYQDIPHLLLPVVDDPKQAAVALKWAVREMERRYRILAMMGARNLAAYNSKVEEMGIDVVRDLLLSEENQPENMSQLSGGDWLEAFEPDETGAPHIGKLPYIVVIIDELADLMMIAKKEVEISIARIAQKARAAGIHLVIATQRPSTDVVTGLIKANLPSRASFQLASYIDSKTILDRQGAERLLGQGDMLFIPPGVSSLLRLHGAYLSDEEIAKITSYLCSQGKPAYRDEILVDDGNEDGEDGGDGENPDDELFSEAIELVKRSGHASASFLQRHLKVGYNRAARMIETMEYRGIVGPADGARPREVLMR